MAQLLREFYELCEGGVCQDLLTESEKSFVREGGMMLSGKLQEAECDNGNGRRYPMGIMEREVQNINNLSLTTGPLVNSITLIPPLLIWPTYLI